MTDVHSHILPSVDDGSASVEESVKLLTMLSEQGVDTVAATPHFYADYDDLGSFLKRRLDAYNNLMLNTPASLPQIRLGAEVAYFDGISYSDAVNELTIEGTPLLLVEMPMDRWSGRMTEELLRLASGGNVCVLLAHIERCMPFQKWDVWEALLENGVLMQSNASFFLDRRARKQAVRLLKDGCIHMLGSDCHNLTMRAPHLGEAYEVIERYCGREAIERLAMIENDFFR